MPEPSQFVQVNAIVPIFPRLPAARAYDSLRETWQKRRAQKPRSRGSVSVLCRGPARRLSSSCRTWAIFKGLLRDAPFCCGVVGK